MANQKLQELLEMKVCDEETAENLVNGGTLVREEIDLIYNSFLSSYGESKGNKASQKESRIAHGKRLLKLEEELLKLEEIPHEVESYLQNPKVHFLLENLPIPLRNLYLNALNARTKNTLDEFRTRYNEGIPAQQEFIYGKIITVPFNGRGALKNEMEQNLQNNMNSVPNLILDKLERVLEEIRRQYAENNVAIMNRVFNNPEILKYLRKEIRIEELEDRE